MEKNTTIHLGIQKTPITHKYSAGMGFKATVTGDWRGNKSVGAFLAAMLTMFSPSGFYVLSSCTVASDREKCATWGVNLQNTVNCKATFGQPINNQGYRTMEE